MREVAEGGAVWRDAYAAHGDVVAIRCKVGHQCFPGRWNDDERDAQRLGKAFGHGHVRAGDPAIGCADRIRRVVARHADAQRPVRRYGSERARCRGPRAREADQQDDGEHAVSERPLCHLSSVARARRSAPKFKSPAEGRGGA
jgi:hypothetical protein